MSNEQTHGLLEIFIQARLPFWELDIRIWVAQ